MTSPDKSTPRLSRRTMLGLGIAASLAGCVGAPGADRVFGNDDDDEREVEDSAFISILEEPVVPLAWSLDELVEGEVNSPAGDDDIPAIDEPTIAGPDAVEETLHENSVVFGVEFDGQARAYPLRVMVWHEIVNDTFAGRDIAVTYCPLTGTAMGFDRGDVTFGVRGSLINSNLILFDRQTDSCWPQIIGTAVDGPLRGSALPEFRVIWTTWGRWLSANPETTVMTDDTGFIRDYGRNPYGRHDPPSGYNISDSLLFPVMHEDDRYHPKRIFMGARTAEGAVAFDKERLQEDRLLSASVGGVDYLAAYEESLDTAFVYRDAAGEANGGDAIELDGDSFHLDGARYDAAGLPLESVIAFDAMWFAWTAFYPDTEVVS